MTLRRRLPSLSGLSRTDPRHTPPAWPAAPGCTRPTSVPSTSGCGPARSSAASVPSYRLDPAKDLLHPFGTPLTQPLTLMPGGPSVYGGTLLPRHMGRDLQLPAPANEALGVAAPVGAHCDSPGAPDSSSMAASLSQAPSAAGWRSSRFRHTSGQKWRASRPGPVHYGLDVPDGMTLGHRGAGCNRRELHGLMLALASHCCTSSPRMAYTLSLAPRPPTFQHPAKLRE